MSETLVFLLGLPLAVYTLAGLFALIDFTDKARALLLVTLRIAINVLLLLIFGSHCWPWLLAAYGLVLFAHLSAFFGLRIALGSGRWITRKID
jgi:hypothetical protein